MDANELTSGAKNIQKLVDYLKIVTATRLELLSEHSMAQSELPELRIEQGDEPLSDLFAKREISFEECIVLCCALVSEICPSSWMDNSLVEDNNSMLKKSLVLGYTGNYLPSLETALILIHGENIGARQQFTRFLYSRHWLFEDRILQPLNGVEEIMSQRLWLTHEFAQSLYGITGRTTASKHATLITSHHTWDDLILSDTSKDRLHDVLRYIQHENELRKEWGMHTRILPGYRVLFHGPSGTGKTMAAGLLGKHTGRDVYKIDMSSVVSKYIGETEKNLAEVFKSLENTNSILFFDEADALFGKRTNIKDAHDRYANQEVSYLLQRIETFKGIVILASNLKGNMDTAFLRRFNTLVPFNTPNDEQRKRIWQNNLPLQKLQAEESTFLDEVAKYPISGGAIVNAVQHACLLGLSSEEKAITTEHAIAGIALEVEKQGKVFSR